MDGFAGARTDLSAAPSIDIANGAPTGDGATNQIVDVVGRRRLGINDEQGAALVVDDGGSTGASPAIVSLAGDRPIYAAPAISPAGDRIYVVYEARPTPWRGADMTSPAAVPRRLPAPLRWE